MSSTTKYKHGKPGIGATGKRGPQGESGSSFYIYDIKNDFPNDVFITGEDIIELDLLTKYNLEYKNISYSISEKKLHPKYKEGDTFFIITRDLSTNDVNILSYLTLTSNHVLCTYDYFVNSCDNAFTYPVSYKYINKNYIHHKLNIVNDEDCSAIYKEQDKYGNAVINGTLLSDTYNDITIDHATDDEYYKTSYHDYIPVIYDTSVYYNIVNNGATLNVYKCDIYDAKDDTLITFSDNSTHSLNINTNYKGIKLSTNSLLNIDNLYIKNNNKGNVEAENVLFNPYLLLDEKGYCYTLNINDYNANTQCLLSDINKFFTEIPDDISLYHTGYIHTMYNYKDISYYRPNYIQDNSIISIDVSVIRKDTNGEYVRDWDLLLDIKNDFIKELLANYTTDTKLDDISNLLDKSVSETEKKFYKNKTGIICVDYVNKDVSCVIISDLIPCVHKYYADVIDASNNIVLDENGHKKTEEKTDIIKWEYIKIFDENIYDKLRIYVLDEKSKQYNIQVNKYTEDLINNIEETLSEYLDTSYYSNIIYKNDISDPIQLAIYDNNANLYSNHEIIQYIQSPDGIRYYSKPTYAEYDTYSNTFNIITSEQTFVNDVKETVSDEGEDRVFNYNIIDNILYIEDINDVIDNSIIYVTYNGDVSSLEKGENSNTFTYDIPEEILDSVKADTIRSTYINNSSILDDLLSGNIHQVNNYGTPILIEYSTIEDPSTKQQETYYINSFGYEEKRTVPKIDLHIYNDMESLDKFNKIENGITSNMFSVFMKVSISDFDENNWGLYESYFDNLTLNFTLKENTADIRNKLKTVELLTDFRYTLLIRRMPIDADIFNMSLKDIFEYTRNNSLTFNIGLHDEKSFYLHFLISCSNPVTPSDVHLAYIADDINIRYNDTSFGISSEYYYQSNHLYAKLMPIALTAEYENTDKTITYTGLKQFGSDKLVTVSMYPVDSSYVLKNRYLQDNIESLDINPININDIYESLPESLYNEKWLSKDEDDIYYTYLMLQYNAKNTYMFEDEEIFCYNNEKYLASKYNQVNNHAGIFVEQNISKQLRDKTMISSISIWNNEYKALYHKDSDNPFVGHNNVYGNGYQYLDYDTDMNQYISDGILSLQDILKIGEYKLFDDVYTKDVAQPENQDNYTPDVLYSSLVEKIGWIYPQYTTEDNIQVIHARNMTDAPNVITNINDLDDMPYNYMYTIYPRVLYNDEKQENVILMLQMPDISSGVTKYEVPKNDYYLNILN